MGLGPGKVETYKRIGIIPVIISLTYKRGFHIIMHLKKVRELFEE
jgi:hypothetical protein